MSKQVSNKHEGPEDDVSLYFKSLASVPTVQAVSIPDNNQADDEQIKQTIRTTPMKSSSTQSHIKRLDSPVTMTKLIHENSMLKQKIDHLSSEHERQLQTQLQQMRSHEQIELKMKKQIALLEKRHKEAVESTKKANAQVDELTRKLREYEAKEEKQNVTGRAGIEPSVFQRRGNGSPIPYGLHMRKKQPPSSSVPLRVHDNVPSPVPSPEIPSSRNQYRLTTSPQRAAQLSAAYAHPAVPYSKTYSPPPPPSTPIPTHRISTSSEESKLAGFLPHYIGSFSGAVPPNADVESRQSPDYTLSIPISSLSESGPSSSSSLTTRLLNAASSKFSAYTSNTSTSSIEEISPC